MPALFLYPGLLVLLLVGLYPFLYCLTVATQNFYLATPQAAHWVGLQNFISFIEDDNFWNSVWVTTRYLVIAIAFECVLGFAIALLLNARLRLHALWRTTILIPLILAPIVVGSMWKFMLNNQSGIIPYLLGLVGFNSLYLGGPDSAFWSVLAVEIWQWTPFVTLISLAGLSNLPVEPFEAAAVDGASRWQVLRHLTLPLMRPVLLIAMTLRFIAAYKSFDAVFLLTQGGPGTATQLLALRVYQTAFVNLQIGDASALAILVMIAAIVLTKLFIQRLLEPKGENEAYSP
jgi:multiple sugar transport system permease protein